MLKKERVRSLSAFKHLERICLCSVVVGIFCKIPNLEQKYREYGPSPKGRIHESAGLYVPSEETVQK